MAPGRFDTAKRRDVPQDDPAHREVRALEEWLSILDTEGGPAGHWPDAEGGVFVAINPMSGNDRKAAAVTAYRNALVECDAGSLEAQLGAIEAAGLPFSTLCTSGGKSIHALVRVDATGPDDYRAKVQSVFEAFEPYAGQSLDKGNKDAGRYSRLPDAVRHGKRQELLAVNPEPENAAEWAASADREANNENEMVSLIALASQPIDEKETLVGEGSCRYLERGAVLLLSAPSGVGKSHLISQAAFCWACGRAAFGLPVARAPLRVLIVQAENPPNDARAIADNMIRGLDLSPDERAAVDANTRQIWLPGCTGVLFLNRLAAYLSAWPADLVCLDPLHAFSDGDLTKQETVQAFCRAGLGNIAHEHRVALAVCHHTPKPNTQRDPAKMGAYDFQYMGAGSADLVANWPRAVLTLQPLARGEFLLRAAKRRPPWRGSDGLTVWEIGLRHTAFGVWDTFEATPNMGRTAGRPKAPDAESFADAALRVIAESEPAPRGIIEDRIRSKVTTTRDTARAVLRLLLARGAAVQWPGSGRGAPWFVSVPEKKPSGTSRESIIREVREVREEQLEVPDTLWRGNPPPLGGFPAAKFRTGRKGKRTSRKTPPRSSPKTGAKGVIITGNKREPVTDARCRR
jgi:RecA-family ATPase